MDKLKFIALQAMVVTGCLSYLPNAYCMKTTHVSSGLLKKDQFSPNHGPICEYCISDPNELPRNLRGYSHPECEHVPPGYDGKTYQPASKQHVPFKLVKEIHNNITQEYVNYDYSFLLPRMPTLRDLGWVRVFPYPKAIPRPKNQFSPNEWGAACEDCIEDWDDISWECKGYRHPECEHIPLGYDGKSYVSHLQRYVPYKRIMETSNFAGINVGHLCDRYDYNFGRNEANKPNEANELLDENELVIDFSAEGTRLGPGRYDYKLYKKDLKTTAENIFNQLQ